MFVLVRNQQTIQTLFGQTGANERKVLGPEGRIGGFIEGLAHGADLIPDAAALKPGYRSGARKLRRFKFC